MLIEDAKRRCNGSRLLVERQLQSEITPTERAPSHATLQHKAQRVSVVGKL